MGQTQPTASFCRQRLIETLSCPFFRALEAFVLQWQSRVVATEIFTIWTFLEKRVLTYTP